MSIVPADQHHNGNYGQVQPYQAQYPQPVVPVAAPPPVQAGQALRLTEWANEARAAASLAASLVKTSFVPKAFAGKVEEATAAILTGAEMGLSPMASLRAIYVIHGTPGMYAKTMRAVVQSHGHEIWETEATSTRVTVKGRRKGSDHVESATWTMDRAKTAGVTANDQYRKNPINMLRARATAEVCWLVASDALSGIAASVEELESGDFDRDSDAAVESAVPAKRTAKRKPLERMEPGSEPVLPPSRATVERAEPDTDPSNDAGMEQPQPSRVDAQSRRMFALFNDTVFKAREERLAFISEVVGREVGSSSDLSSDDKSLVIAALERHIAEAQADTDGGQP